MKFGTIVLLLFMCISIHHVLVYSSECGRTIQMLHGRISWLDSANNRLTRKLTEKKGCSHKSVNYSHGQTFEDLCNTCVCNNGLVACTNNLCNEECSHKSVTYAHGESFVDVCNMCVCNHGLVACTNNTCNEGCMYSGMNHSHGDMFTSGDGCFTCTCQHGCVECETRICASPGQLGPLGGASHSAPTATDEPGGFVSPDAHNPPWAAVDGNPATFAYVENGDFSTFAWWELEFQCTETVTAVHLTSSDAGDPADDFHDLVVTVDGALCGMVTTAPAPLETVTVTCPEPLTGKTLQVLKNDNDNELMRLAEVVPVLAALPSGEVCQLVPLL